MRREVLGIILVFAGLIVYSAQAGFMSGQLFLFLVALGLLVGYLYSNYRTGLLVGATCTAAVALFVTITEQWPELSGGWLFFFLIGMAFFTTFLVQRYVGTRAGWALYPGMALLAFAAFLYVEEAGHVTLSFAYWRYWPLILVVIGIYLLFSSRQKGEVDDNNH